MNVNFNIKTVPGLKYAILSPDYLFITRDAHLVAFFPRPQHVAQKMTQRFKDHSKDISLA